MSKLTVLEDIITKWTKADKEAQIEGAKRLGLPTNNTAKDRAKAMGFGDTQYHGTIQYFDGFDPKKTNKGIFYTSPDTELANTFATDFKPDGALPMVMPLKTRGKVFDYENPEHIDLIKNEIKPPDMLYNEGINTNPVFNEDKMLDAIQNGRWQVLERNDVQDTIKKLGFDGFNVTEGRKGWSDAKNVGLYNASDIRSPLAHFNPKYAGVGAGSILSADLMANENNKGNMSNSFFDDISERAEARRNLSWERQKSLIDSGIATPSLTNGSVDNSLTAEQAQAKTQLQDQKSRQAYSELMALPVGAVEGMLGIGGDVELLGQGIKGAYNADSGNRWEGFKEGLSDRDTMFWSTLDNQERTDQWLEGTEFGDRLKEGAGGRLVGEILAPLPPVAGVAKYGGKALNVLDDGITTANKFLDKNNIQAGLSIKDVSPKYTLQGGVKQTDTSLDFLKADEITQARQAQNRADLTKPLVNAQGTDNLGYKVRESDYAIGNSNDVVDSSLITRASNPNANRFDLADIGEGKFPKDQYIETKPDSFYDSLYKSQNKYGDLVEYDAKKTLERANSKNTDQRNIAEWENVFGKPTGSGKLGADKTVNPDLGLTYDGSEFPASLDPDAVKLTPNGRPTKAPQPEVDPFGDLTDEAFNIVIDANGNKIRQPKGNLNIKDMSYEDLQKSMSKDIEIQTPRGTVYRNLDDYTDSLDMGLDPATGKMQSPIYDAKNIDESVRNANKNDTHFTGDMADIGRKNIKDVELDTTINKVHDLVYDEVPTALNKADRVVDGQTIRPINDYLDGLDVKGTIAKGKLKTIQDLANNNFNSLDTKLNSLTRILDDVQTAVPKTTFNKKSQEAIIDAVHHAMFDAFEQAYKTNRIDAVAKKTIDTQLDKLINLKNADGTTSQSLKLVPRKGDSAKVMKRSPNHRRQRIEKDRGSPDIERLPANDTPTQNRGLLDADDYETLQDTGSQGYNSGEGANTFKNTYTPASSTRRTKSKDAPKRSKRSKLTSKEEEELMPWLEDLPNYNFKGYR